MDFHNHGSSCFDDTSWAIWQYHDADSGSGIVMAFRRSESPFDTVKIKLKGLSEGKDYIFTNLNDNTAVVATDKPFNFIFTVSNGDSLRRNAITIPLPESAS